MQYLKLSEVPAWLHGIDRALKLGSCERAGTRGGDVSQMSMARMLAYCDSRRSSSAHLLLAVFAGMTVELLALVNLPATG